MNTSTQLVKAAHVSCSSVNHPVSVVAECVAPPSSRYQQLPADGPQEHDVQTAAAARQTLGDGAAQHLGPERSAGLSVSRLKPRLLDTVTPGFAPLTVIVDCSLTDKFWAMEKHHAADAALC